MTTATIIQQQKERLQQIKEDAHDIATTLADQVWDSFELEIDEATEDGFMFDTASMTKSILSSALSQYYQDAFERDVLGVFEKLREQLIANVSEATLTNVRLDLAGLRKGLKLRRHTQTLIEQAIDSAKPGVGRVLGTILGDLLRDPVQQMDALDDDMKRDAKRVRAALYRLKSAITTLIIEETEQLIGLGRREYAELLQGLAEGEGVGQNQASTV